jgi:5'-3' exonuclease
MELNEVIEILKLMEKECYNQPDVFGSHKMVYNAPAIFSYKHNYKEALQTILSFLSKIQDAEMPPKIDSGMVDIGVGSISNPYEDGYNQCHNEWFAYHTKKMSEKVDVEKIKDIVKEEIEGVEMSLNSYCSKLGFPARTFHYINHIAKAIAKEINKEV